DSKRASSSSLSSSDARLWTMLMPPRGNLPSAPCMFLEDAPEAKLRASEINKQRISTTHSPMSSQRLQGNPRLLPELYSRSPYLGEQVSVSATPLREGVARLTQLPTHDSQT